MVRNEADVIEAFVRHHGRFLDQLLVVCHFSQDATLEILSALAEEGLPLQVEYDPRPIHDQGKIMTRLARRAVSEHGADLVVALDGDEFVIATDGSDTPRAALDALPTDRVTTLAWKTYVVSADDPPDEPNVLRRIRHRPSKEKHLGKVIVPRAIVERRGVEIDIGSHVVVDRRRNVELEGHRTEALALAHYPFRGDDHLRAKVLGGWPVTYANPHRWPGQNEHWLMLFDEYRSQDGAFSLERIQRLSLDYSFSEGELVLDPVEPQFELRHPPTRVDANRIFYETVLGLADEVRRLSADPPSLWWRLYATTRRRLRALLRR
jgi:hypothetical protein